MIEVDYRCRFCHDVGCDACGAPEEDLPAGVVGECVACGVVEKLPDGSRCASCIQWEEHPPRRWQQEHPECL